MSNGVNFEGAPERISLKEWRKKDIEETQKQIEAIERTLHPDVTPEAEILERLRKLKQKLAGLLADQATEDPSNDKGVE